MYAKNLLKKDLAVNNIKMSSSEIDKLVADKILTIDPATGKTAIGLGNRAVLQSKYGGDWSGIKISAGPQVSPMTMQGATS